MDIMETKETQPNWFQKVFTSLKDLSLGKRKTSTETDNSHHYLQKFENVGEWKFPKNRLHDKQALMNKITEDGKELQKAGIADGAEGLNPIAMKRITQNIASLWQSLIESSFQHKLIISKGKRTDIQSHYDSLKENEKSLNDHKSVIDTHYKYNSKNYSLLYGAIYIIIAVLLLMADFPLSMQTAKEGFQLTDEEASSIALGMVLMTVYFKVIYDEYLGNSVQKLLLKKRAENLLGEVNTATEKEIKTAKSIRIIKLIIKLVILSLLIITICTLGVFRFGFLEADANHEGEANIYYHAMKSISGKYSFIFISIIFPIIGGVCASLGFSNLRNVWDRRSIRKRMKRAQSKKEKTLKKLLIANGTVEECENNLEWVNESDNFLTDCSAYFFSSYLHGYDKGIRQNIPEDFFEAAIHLRNKHVAMTASDLFSQQITDKNLKKGLYDSFFPQVNLIEN